MSIELPADITASLQSFLASGYHSEIDVLRDALAALKHQANVAFIQAGVDDMNAGRYRTLEEVDAELRREYGMETP